MNPCAPFIRRPVATSLLAFAILLVGLTGFRYLPLSALPEVDYPTIQVQAFYPGASPDVMATSVTAVLERNFGQMPGLREMTSVSSGGQSIVTLQFDLSLSLDIAEQQVQAAINQGGTLLPALPQPPIYRKVNPADAPVITLALHGDEHGGNGAAAASKPRPAAQLVVFGALDHVGDIGQIHRRAILVGDDDAAILVHRPQLVVGVDGVGLSGAVKGALGGVGIVVRDGGAQVVNVQAIGRELLQVGLHAHGRAGRAWHGDDADARKL